MENYAGLVRAHLDLGQAREAGAWAREALEHFPHSALAHMLAGKVYEKAGTPAALQEVHRQL